MSAAAAVEPTPAASGSDGNEKKRSNADEEALDRRIKEIQEKNRLLEERQKVKQDEARENGVPKAVSQPIANGEDGRLVKNNDEESKPRKSKTPDDDSNQPQKRNGYNNNRHRPARGQNSPAKAKSPEEAPKWSREWDAGKLPADQWKMNVPQMDDSRPSGSGSGRVRPLRANNRPAAGKKPTAENYRPAQRNGKPVNDSESPRQVRTPRNPGFFHDDRSAPAADGAATPSESQATAAPPTQRRKPVITGLPLKPSPTNEKEDLGTGRNSRGPRSNKAAKDVKETVERKSNAPTDEKPRRNRGEGRGRYGGGARRTSANDEDDKTANAANNNKRGEKKPQRRRSNTRDDVRRVVRSIVNRVCVELGEPENEQRGNRKDNERSKNSKENRETFDDDVKNSPVEGKSELADVTPEVASADPSETIPADNEKSDGAEPAKNGNETEKTEDLHNANLENSDVKKSQDELKSEKSDEQNEESATGDSPPNVDVNNESAV